MPVDYYLGRSLEELEGLLRAAQDRKARGNITEVTAAGIRTVRDFGSQQAVEKEIFNLRYSLFLRAGDITVWPDPRLERTTRVRTRYVSNSQGYL